MTELIWDGKYKDGKKQGPVRIALPFQNIETVNESTQDRQHNLELFASGRDTEWRNRLIWGDKKYVLPSLLPELAGKVNLIYIDPPFDTGADFSFTTNIPDESDGSEDGTARFTKEPSVLEQKAYRDTWGHGLDSYLEWVYSTVVLLSELLAQNGSIYVHCDSGVNSYIRIILDEVFGSDNFRNELTWKRRVGMSSSVHESNRFGICTDTIFFYAASDNTLLAPQYNKDAPEYQEYIAAKFTLVDDTGRRFQADNLGNPSPRPNLMYEYKGYKPPRNGWAISREKMEEWDREGRLYFPKDRGGRIRRKRYLDELKGMPVQNLWTDIAEINSQAEERVGYPTQKPEALIGRILNASSSVGDLVLDCFIGSGTLAVVAEKLNRRWIACDLSRFAIHTTRKRLLGIPNVKPFVVQNLGKYERQAWQVAEFPANGKDHLEEQRGREAAYRKFILDLYHATPMTGYTWLHGTKSGRMVHVAAVDAPVTQADVKAIAREAWKAIGSGKDAPTKAGVDILGWEFALEVNELAKQVAAQSRVDVSFKKIPREVLDKKAVEQGDVKFFELGALSVDLKQKSREVTLKLSDFVIPTDDIPEEARKAIKHWSQLVDYWAVDWDFKNDTFHNQWQAYRTRRDPKIELETKYEYKEPGKYQIVVKVIDILGNDTTKTLEVSVK
ncbi:MAG TPA: site-specific DNA-methyltransferase [Candidatus Acidoferrales bacterium]|nr:site-specific DNA-methyltransferase [Candidatus Acidoferrales bacterium]